jgi:hypothetical protein
MLSGASDDRVRINTDLKNEKRRKGLAMSDRSAADAAPQSNGAYVPPAQLRRSWCAESSADGTKTPARARARVAY